MNICQYTKDNKQDWDAFVSESKNGTFLFMRDYMDYHAGRFTDHSLMFRNDKGRLVAVMPANERDGILYSHQGLTYGGLVLSANAHTTDIGEIFSLIIGYLKNNGFTEWYYKQIPSIYCQYPSDEDEYWLWRNNARLACCNISCTVRLDGNISVPLERRRKRGIRRALETGLRIKERADIEEFWPIMEENLRTKYNAAPVHTMEEMKLLHSRFPENIQIYTCADSEGNAHAGAIVYVANRQTIHIQYAHADTQGKASGALDMLYGFLIDKYKAEGFSYFDIGTSNERDGWFLNERLTEQKEGFGGRGIAYKHWKISL